MKTKTKIIFSLILIFILAIASSCNRDIPVSYSFSFYPRVCNYVYIGPTRIITKTFEDYTYYQYWNAELDESISIKEFLFSVAALKHNPDSLSSGNTDYYMKTLEDTDEPDTALEEQIETNYIQAGRKDMVSLPTNYPIFIEYRLTGVKDFNIKAIDAQLFDEVIGNSLNKYLKIVNYEPNFIASSINRNLLYGFTDTDKPESIEEWLSLHPLANESMYFAFSVESDKLPLSTRFVVEMETEDGVLLSDTTNMITLIK